MAAVKLSTQLKDRMRRFPVGSDPVWFDDKGFYQMRHGVRHGAVDVFGKRNAPIICPVEGYVPSSVRVVSGHHVKTIPGYGWSDAGGWYVFVCERTTEVEKGVWRYYFAHLDKINYGIVHANMSVHVDAILGDLGNTAATSCKPHEHFQVKYNNIYVDPAPALNEMLRREGRQKHPVPKVA